MTPEDLTAIEAEMKKIVKEDYPFTREVLTKEEALARLKAEGEVYKVELVEELEDGTISFYQQGEFNDLCRGPHLPSTRYAKAYKLTSIAGAYWRGILPARCYSGSMVPPFSTGKNWKATLSSWKRPRSATTVNWAGN